MPVGQRFETYRTEERLLRLDQEDRLREAGIVEAAAEGHARLEREGLEAVDGEPGPPPAGRGQELGEILADQHDVATPEGDAHPVPAGGVRDARDGALD